MLAPIPTLAEDAQGTVAPSSAAKRCDLCGGGQFELIARKGRRGKPLDTGVCVRCGLVVHMEVPTDRDLADYYARQYRYEYHRERVPSPRRVMRAWHAAARLYRRLQPHLDGVRTVFDVGAGLGLNAKVFELNGYDASGIEPGEDFLRYARERLAANVRQAGLFDLAPLPRYDFVLLVHVIEHFNSPSRALRKIHELLEPDGYLYVECPNLAAPFAFRNRMFHAAHIHNFTPWTLAGMVEQCGFRVERWLEPEQSNNLHLLLKRADFPRLAIDPLGYRRTLEAFGRHNVLTYHLRPRYLGAQVRRIAGLLRERVLAARFVRRLSANLTAASWAESAEERLLPSQGSVRRAA